MLLRLVLIIMCLRFVPVYAQEYRVGVEGESYPPYYNVVDAEYLGFFRSILDAFALDQGYIFNYVTTPVNRLNMSLRDGIIDIRVPDNPNWYKS